VRDASPLDICGRSNVSKYTIVANEYSVQYLTEIVRYNKLIPLFSLTSLHGTSHESKRTSQTVILKIKSNESFP